MSLKKMYRAQVNSPSTMIMGDISATSTSATVGNAAVLPDELPFLLTFGYDTSASETVLVTEVNENDITFVRGVDGAALAWSAGTKCARVFTAKDLNDIQDNVLELESEHSDMSIALDLLLNYARQNAWYSEHKTAELTNGGVYPNNNSQKSIPLGEAQESTDYLVITEVLSPSLNVGEVVVSDKLTNGFKLAYTGSAKAAKIKYTVLGGYLK